MKTILTLLFIVITFTFSSYSQEIFIYGENGEKIYLQEIDSILQIKFKENTDNLEMIRTARTVNPNMAVSIVPINNRIFVPVKDIQFDKEELKINNSIVYVNSSLLSEDGTIQIPTDKVLVKVSSGKYELKYIIQ